MAQDLEHLQMAAGSMHSETGSPQRGREHTQTPARARPPAGRVRAGNSPVRAAEMVRWGKGLPPGQGQACPPQCVQPAESVRRQNKSSQECSANQHSRVKRLCTGGGSPVCQSLHCYQPARSGLENRLGMHRQVPVLGSSHKNLGKGHRKHGAQ